MSTELQVCITCGVPREASTLVRGECPFCVTEPPPLEKLTKRKKPAPKPKLAEVTPVAPRVTDVIDEDTAKEEYNPPSFDMKAAAANPLAELAARELARRRLMPFIKRFRPKYDAGWVHLDICRRLERFVKDVEAGLSPRMLLMMPPRGGKSEIGSRNFPPWVLGQHPDWEIIAASHTASLTMSFSRYVRDVLRDPAYHALFPECQLDPSSQSVENWNLTTGGGYLAAGVGTGITGRGAHILLLDDLVKDKEAAASGTIADNTWEWYASTAYTRLAPGGGVLGIMTWWSDNDWAGRIQAVMASGEGDKFEIVRYPAINERGDEYLLADDTIVEILPGELAPSGARMTRPMGTALHPARYTTEMMLRIKRNLFAAGQQWVWSALYQQNPSPDEGLFFTKEMFRYYGMMPPLDEMHIYQAWDFAITENRKSDYTVGVTIGQDHRDNLYVLDVRRFRSDDSLIIVEQLIDFAVEWSHNKALPTLGFEDGQIWKTMEAVFLKRCDERHIYPAYEALTPATDKTVRASPLRGRMQLGKIYFDEKAPWFADLYFEFTRFPAGKHDDIIDAVAWCVRLTLSAAAPKQKNPEKKLPSWKDKLHLLTGDNAGGSHMSA